MYISNRLDKRICVPRETGSEWPLFSPVFADDLKHSGLPLKSCMQIGQLECLNWKQVLNGQADSDVGTGYGRQAASAAVGTPLIERPLSLECL